MPGTSVCPACGAAVEVRTLGAVRICPACGMQFPPPPHAKRRRRWAFRVALLLLLGAAGGVVWFRVATSEREGHRRPVLLGLWQPPPRDRDSVKARFEASIRWLGPGWGTPTWIRKPSLYGPSYGPHDYIVHVPCSIGAQRYLIEATAPRTDQYQDIHIDVLRRRDGDWVRVAGGWSRSREDLLILLKEQPGLGLDELAALQAAAECVEAALRRALE
jgi:hypothetical protein